MLLDVLHRINASMLEHAAFQDRYWERLDIICVSSKRMRRGSGEEVFTLTLETLVKSG